jgi:hypothetical protein
VQLAVGLAGAAVGFLIGGPAGAQAGFAIGSALGASFAEGPQGPRLSDKRIQISSYGAALGLSFGGPRHAGGMIWAAPLREVEREEGGKGGPSVTTYSYYGTFAIAIDGRQHTAIRRIWAEGELIYNTTSDASDDELRETYRLQQQMTFYTGSETQLPDATIESYEGVGTVEAYRGVCYVVFDDVPLERYGNRIPSLEFEMGGDEAEACVPPDSPVISVVDLDPPSHGTLRISWAAADGADSYQAFRVNPDGTTNELSPAFVGGQWIADSALALSEWVIAAEYLHYVVAINECGSSQSNVRRAIWYGQFGGAGAYTAQVPTVICQQIWGPPYGGYGAATWGAICYRSLGGSYAGTQTSTDILYVDLGDFDGEEGDPLAGVVEPSSMLLGDIVHELCEAAGLTALDVSSLDDVVLGYSVPRQMPARAAIDSLRQAYYFDLIEIEAQVAPVRRGGASVVTIPADDMGATESGEAVTLVAPERAQEAALPAEVSVAYSVREADYATGVQQSRRVTTGSQQVVSIELPMVLTDAKAAEVADVLMYDAWAGRTTRRFTTTKKYTYLTPGDVVTLDDDQFQYTGMIVSKLENGPLIEWEFRDIESAAYSPNSQAATTPGGGGAVVTTGVLQADLMDVPAARDADYNSPGYYVAAHGSSFVGGVLYKSTDGGSNYSALQSLNVPATYGLATSVLGDYDGGNTVDEQNSVTVTMERGTLATITRAALLNLGNYALLGDEFVCFRKAELLSGRTYRLSGFLRARRGTVGAMSTHAAGERFLLLSESNVYRVEQSLGELGEATYKPVSYGRALIDATAQAFTNTGAALKPLPVSHLAGVDIGGGDFTIKWKRRGRIGQEWRDGVDVPLTEASESYLVEVFASGVLDSTQTVSAETATVSAAAGNVVTVTQLSATVGRGYPASITLA